MVDVTFQINGRKFQPNQVEDALTKAILANVAEQIKKNVGSVTCPHHGKSPQIIGKGKSIENLSSEVSGCCDSLVLAVKQKLCRIQGRIL